MNIFKKIMIGVSVLIFCAASVGTYIYFQYRNIAVYDDSFKKQKIKSYKGHLVVFVWSAHCANCVYNLSDIDYLQQYVEYKGGKLITVLANDDIRLRNAAKATFIRQKLRNFTSFFDKDSKLCAFYGVEVFPTMLLFKNGKLIKKIDGSRPWKNGNDLHIIDEFLQK